MLIISAGIKIVQKLECVEVEVGERPRSSVIWLHGLGADGHDFEAVVPELRLSGDPAIRFVFPHAPTRPVTVNNGMPMRAWYDIVSFDRAGRQDEEGVRESAALVTQLLEREHERGSDRDRIVLAGFSQGGAIALHAALRFPHRLAGVMALSTYLPVAESLQKDVVDNPELGARDVPIFMAHGLYDPVLPIQMGRESRKHLESVGFEVQWHEYPMAHAVCAEEVRAIRKWLAAVLPRRQAS